MIDDDDEEVLMTTLSSCLEDLMKQSCKIQHHDWRWVNIISSHITDMSRQRLKEPRREAIKI